MKKISSNFFPALLLLMITADAAFGQCNATFTYFATGATTYHFTPNQPLQTGYTYYHSWRVDGSVWTHTPSADLTLNQTGNYQICHTISIQDSNATTLCYDSSCIMMQINIPPPCFPSVSAYANSTTYHDYTFTNSLANYTNVSVRWTFGDGSSVNGIASPSHYYNAFGYYNICLYLTDTIQGCGDTVCIWVNVDSTVSNPCQLNAAFHATQSNYNTPLINFTNSSYGSYNWVHWDYGDGTQSSTNQATHLYPGFGTYLVCLIDSNTSTGCGDNYCQYVYIDSCNRNFSLFSANIDYYNPLLVNFSPDASTPFTAYLWDFGDGQFDANHLFAHHIYPGMGTYQVCFHVTVPGCNVVDTCSQIILQCHGVYASFTNNLIAPNVEQFHADPNYGNNNIVYTWNFGDTAAGDDLHPVHVYALSGTYNVCLTATDTVTGCSDSICNLVFPNTYMDTVCGHIFYDTNFNGIQDSAESPLINLAVQCTSNGNYFVTDSDGYYQGLVPWDIFGSTLELDLLYPGSHFTTLPFGSDQYIYQFALPNQKQCGFDFGVITTTARVAGTVYADLNQNGQYDSWYDRGLPNQIIHAGSEIALTGSDGNYLMALPTANYNIWRDSNSYAGFAVPPLSYSVNAYVQGAMYSGNDFAIGIASNYNDFGMDVVPLTPITHNRQAQYALVTSNFGNSSAVFAHFRADQALLFDSLAYPGFGYDPSTNTVNWFNLSALPFQQNIVNLNFDLSTSAVINQDIYNQGYLFAGDANPSNDRDTVHQIVVASFDPNNKIPDEAGRGPQGLIDKGQRIKFVINFQNTGTENAINIVVKDVLDPSFDLSTFRFVGSKHPCDVHISGDSIYFRFSKILLPFTGEESHGWLAFEVKPKPHLLFGTQLHNTAAIYFDHNEPVITNTTLHTISEPTAIVDYTEDTRLISVPNPFHDYATVYLNDFPTGICKFTITDIMGKQVRNGVLDSQKQFTIERDNLASGTYLITIRNSKGSEAHLKLIAD